MMNDDGTMNDICTEFKGMKRFDARDAIVKRLQELGLYVGKKLLQFGNQLRHANDVAPIAEQNRIIEQRLAGNGSLLNRILGGARRLLPSVSSGKAKAFLAGGIFLGTLFAGGKAEGSEQQEDFTKKTEDENAVSFETMLKTGSAKVRIKNEDGTRYSINGETTISRWFDENLSTATVATLAFIAAFGNKAKNLVAANPIVKPPKSNFNPIPLPKREMPFMKTMLLTTLAYETVDEFMNSDEETTSEEIFKSIAIDTGVTFGSQALISLVPYVGRPLAIAFPFINGAVAKATGYDPLFELSDSIKDYFGVGTKSKLAKMLNANIQMTAESFYQMMEKDDEQSRFIKDYLEKNEVKYDDLDVVQRKILSEIIQSLTKSRLTLGQALALSVEGIKTSKNSGKSAPNLFNKRKLTKEAAENLEQQIEEQFSNDNPDSIDWYSAEAKEKYNDNKKELETQTDPAVLEKLGLEQNELSAIIGYVRYLNGDPSALTEQVFAELGLDPTDESTDVKPEDIKKKREEVLSRWNEYYYSWQEELKNHYRFRKTKEYLETENDWVSEDVDKVDYSNREVEPDASGANIFPQDAINQAILVSQKTGVPADYILGIFYLESNGVWEISEQMHNYGNTKYAGSKGQDEDGHGIYATMEEGAEALANYSIAFGDLESREILKQAALSDNPRAFVYQMKKQGYFTTDVEHYLDMFYTGLSFARGAGIEGAELGDVSTVTQYQPHPQPQTLEDMYNESVRKYQQGMGGSSEITGAMVNGMYIDTSQKFVSIEQKIRELKNEKGIQDQINSYYEQSNQATQEATDKAVYNTSADKIKENEREQDRYKQLVEEERRRLEEQSKTESNIAHLTIMGKLKEGKSLDELQSVVEDIVNSYGIDAKLNYKDVDQIAI